MNTKRRTVTTAYALERWDGAVTEIRRAHDVRQLVACPCGGLAWRDNALHIYPEYYHGRCYIAQFGLKSFLGLPREQTDRMTLSDIGGKVMRRLVAAIGRSSQKEGG